MSLLYRRSCFPHPVDGPPPSLGTVAAFREHAVYARTPPRLATPRRSRRRQTVRRRRRRRRCQPSARLPPPPPPDDRRASRTAHTAAAAVHCSRPSPVVSRRRCSRGVSRFARERPNFSFFSARFPAAAVPLLSRSSLYNCVGKNSDVVRVHGSRSKRCEENRASQACRRRRRRPFAVPDRVRVQPLRTRRAQSFLRDRRRDFDGFARRRRPVCAAQQSRERTAGAGPRSRRAESMRARAPARDPAAVAATAGRATPAATKVCRSVGGLDT